jgi:hypothetical protein
MALTITGEIMRGDRTPHTAALADGGWLVGWLVAGWLAACPRAY